MRRLSFVTAGLLFLALGGGVAPAQAQQAGLKIGYINSQSILEQAPGAQAAQEQFNKDMEGYRAEVQKMAEELETLIKQYETQQVTLSPEAKQNRERSIREKQQAYQQRVQTLDQQAGQRQAELVQPVMDRITEVIETLREEGRYSLIFDVSAGSIISADPSLDLTEEVVRRLRAEQTTSSRD